MNWPKTLLASLAVVCSINANAKQIALSFDDAPLAGSAFMSGTEKTANIIEQLQKAKVDDALFFVTTNNIKNEADKNRLNAYTQAGFHLAHHSHKHLSANKISAAEYLADFDQAEQLLAPFDKVLKLHRHPYLHYGKTPAKRQTIYNHLSAKGYQFGYVTVDNFDWYINSKMLTAIEQGKKVDYQKLGQLYVDILWQSIEFYDQLAQKHLNRSPKHILLLHENEVAALFIGQLATHIKNQGWEIISPEQAYQDSLALSYHPRHNHFNKQGRIASLAALKGVDKTELRHESEHAEFIDKQFEQYQVIID
ncbi:polysaccharide deacetylase family protein [Catenovulum sp. SM1970]|uniref:polysaccharide deacetylase family protein n=1 Tax=Marinifaba aquimaris TaxID=2741323 RepID=UPI0015740457|nr:polysaccharide deacetylase family protein [Marinifaba aquimaris]NTS78122.1 polysaccharide deacetylase family protein [Marinifaba aquimaris]